MLKQKQRLLAVTAGAFLCCLVMAGACHAVESTKTGYIDINRLINESNMGKAASAGLKSLRSQKQSDLKKSQSQIAELEALLGNPKTHLDASAQVAKVRELADLRKEYKRMSDDANEAIRQKNDDIVRNILEKAMPIIKHEAEKHGYTMIFKNPADLIYVDKSVDITDSVIQRLNKK